ncbi:citramalate synthase [Enemella sp. A6]|uniref:citramalate synthase n=1 Tax=Enemella sp. A6 TaxID=3440152 RepID=UPI003EB8D5FB
MLPVAPEQMHLYDTTLRDGSQQEGLRLTVADKLRIAGYLDDLGMTHIEGGWPGANPNDTTFFARAAKELNLRNAQLVAFGATRKADKKVEDDPQVRGLLDAGTSVVTLVAKSHDAHVQHALRTSLTENLDMVRDTVRFLVAEGREVILDCEHFFDGYRANPGYSLEVVHTAAEAGASVVVLCDTNGGMLPSWMGEVVSAAGEIGVNLGIHCHNDSGCAVANSIAAVEAGAMHVQGTVNGYGERTGNADLLTVAANLQLKFGWDLVSPESMAEYTRLSHAIAEVTNVGAGPRQPYVGVSAFAHKAGLHASAIKVDPNLYQHIDPALVGNDMRILVSDMAGRASIQIKGEQMGFDLSDMELAGRVMDRVKQREAEGYTYEAADASFELLLRDELGALTNDPFTVIQWRTGSTGDTNGNSIAEATVKLVADDQQQYEVGDGNGPVNALDHALRRALTPVYPVVADYRLTDYRVRILDQGRGTDAVVRVLIDTSDGERQWTTVGVGTDVIEASWEALTDAYRYGLLHALTPVEPVPTVEAALS